MKLTAKLVRQYPRQHNVSGDKTLTIEAPLTSPARQRQSLALRKRSSDSGLTAATPILAGIRMVISMVI